MEKKSLITNLKSTKKAHLIKAGAKNEGTSTRKVKLDRKTRARYGKTSLSEFSF